MPKFIITTDNMADLPASYYRKHNIPCAFLTYTMDGEVYGKDKQLPNDVFYKRMRDGSMPTTSQMNTEDAKVLWRPLLKDGYDILHIAFSSGLSGTCSSCQMAAEEIKAEYPDRQVVVVDSLCASLGQGLFVHYAVTLKEAGKAMDEIVKWLEENKLHLVHAFTVNDLFHLHRGGRVSKMTAVLGTMINIKPLLHVDDEGHLTQVGKVRGRRKSLTSLVDMMEEKIKGFEAVNQTVFISHGDCLDDAEFVARLVKERFGISDILIDYVGPTIGSHSGPGTLALFFLGNAR